MFKQAALFACSVLFAGQLFAADAAAPTAASSSPHVLLTTSLGEIEIELNQAKAPISVANFLAYVDKGFYSKTVFHRVIPGFMVQAGGFDTDMRQKNTQSPIKNEADNGLHNVRGTLAMARTSIVDSATSQFFINQKDNAFLDHGGRDFGYAVFGKVVKGMDIVDKISQVPTGRYAGMSDVPNTPVLILSAKRL